MLIKRITLSVLFIAWIGTHAMADSLADLQQAADQGDASAQTRLGVAYGSGQGVEKDYFTAVKWFRLAAAQGDAVAQLNLGVSFYNGNGVPRNYSEAMTWFARAADNSKSVPKELLGEAPEYLGEAYKAGRVDCRKKKTEIMLDESNAGVSCVSYILAYKWFNIAALFGNERAAAKRDLLGVNMPSWDVFQAEDMSTEWWKSHRFK